MGIESKPTTMVSFPSHITISGRTHPAGSVNFFQTLGGGFLGTNPYMLLNASEMNQKEDYKTDGGVKVHRRWGKAIFSDLFCREIPVVRESDVVDFVDTTSEIPFRNSKSCVKCHASQDRLAAVIRNFKTELIGKGFGTPKSSLFPTFHAITQGAEAAWPTTPDPNYYRRPTNGVLFYRSYTGALVNQPVSSVQEVGNKIALSDDYYACIAKRYYKYFTGIDVTLSDLGDPLDVYQPTPTDLSHRTIVHNLGQSLKTDQSLRSLIKNIFALESYRKSDFGLGGK